MYTPIITQKKEKVFEFSALDKEVEKDLVKKGFKLTKDLSSTARLSSGTDKAYSKMLGFAYADRPVTVFVFPEGIGLDIDFEPGKNFINNFWSFSKSGGFEKAYRKMVNFANDYLDHRITD